MFRPLVVVLLTLAVLVTPVVAALPKHLDSVRPLLDNGDHNCTTWSIHQAKGLWMTAAHCVVTGLATETGEIEWYPSDTLTIGEKSAQVVKYDVDRDLALLESETHAPGLRFGKYPQIGDTVTVYGFPGGWRTPLPTWLRVSNPLAIIDKRPWMILDGSVWPGHSGSPVLDKKGKVIGLLQAHGNGRYSGLTLASSWAALLYFGLDAWER